MNKNTKSFKNIKNNFYVNIILMFKDKLETSKMLISQK